MIRPNGRVTGAVVHGGMNEWEQLVSSAESGIKKFAITAIFVTADCKWPIITSLVDSEQNVEECDATEVQSRFKAGYKNLKLQQKN